MKLLLGNCLDRLKELSDNSVDSIVTDPPYGLSFMAKKWDYDVPSTEIWKECLRVLKPGGHLLAFAGSRTYHRMAVRIEDAGFEIRDQIMWVYGSGFPKSHDVGKNIEKRKVGGIKNLKQVGTKQGIKVETGTQGYSYNKEYVPGVSMGGKQISGEIPVYEITNEYKGWGTALKPAHEPIVMARKPLSENSVADNVIKWGTGGINIDDSRIGTEERTYDLKGGENINKLSREGKGDSEDAKGMGAYGQGAKQISIGTKTVEGRFPANIIFDEEAGKLLDEQSGIIKGGKNMPPYQSPIENDIRMNASKQINRIGYGDTGGASRFFYCPKTNEKERNEGMDTNETRQITGRDTEQDKRNVPFQLRPVGRKNTHPTVKPTDLMSYLIRLITPPNGIVLDPFMGSGSTGKAAVRGGWDFIGIELDGEYYKIAEARIGYEIANPSTHENSVKSQKPKTDKLNKFFE